MESVRKYKDQLAQLRTPKSDDTLGFDLLQYGVTEKYYNEVVKAVKLLVHFESQYVHTQKLYGYFSELIDDADADDIKLCVLVDVMRCYDGLNHPTSFTSPEGVALLLLIDSIYAFGKINKYEDLRMVDSSTISLIDLTPYISECSYELGKRHTLLLSELLEKEDSRIDTLYRTIVYNLCKKIAEVDGEISISEKEWLEEIARLDDDDVTNDIDTTLFD